MKTKLDNSRDTNVGFKKQLDEADNEKRRLEQMCNDYQLQLENIRRTHDETSRERDHSKQQLETTNYQKSTLEKARSVNIHYFSRTNLTKFFFILNNPIILRKALVNQVETLRIECEKLQSANTELHRHRDQLEDEKDDIIKDKLRQIKENERW